MSAFPTLKPAFTIWFPVDPGEEIGALSLGGTETFVNIKPTISTVTTEPGFAPALNAKLVMGGDWIHGDPDGKHLRLDVKTTLKSDDGAAISMSYNGVIAMDEPTGKALGGAADAKTTKYGRIVNVVTFKTGAEQYKEFEHGVFVGSGRFVVESGKPLAVEYKVSQVLAGTGE